MIRPPGILACAAAALVVGACGARSLKEGESPFPAARPVFADGAGNTLRALPDSSEPLRLVLLDFPWCPPCTETWNAVRRASASFPPGSVGVYRVLFDRERVLSAEGEREVPPLRRAEAAPGGTPEAPSPPATILTGMSAPFRDEYRLERVPVLLLIGPDGRVRKRWVGYSESLAESVTAEVARSAAALRTPPEK